MQHRLAAPAGLGCKTDAMAERRTRVDSADETSGGRIRAVKSARAVALTGVFLTAVLMVVLVRPAFREIVGLYGQPLIGVVILVVPTAVLLTATSYRYYGLKRAVVVALVVIAISGAASGFSIVIAVGAAQMPSGSAVVVLALIFAVPFLSVLVLGVLALRLVRGRDAGLTKPKSNCPTP